MSERVGHGVFGWSGTERRSDRYGAFVLAATPYASSDRIANHLDVATLRPLDGKRVRITCKVIANRESGHAGDLALKVFPTTPDVGEVVDLGVGTLRLEDAGYDGMTAVAMVPGDGRDTFWFEPRKLYRLHDQTVDVFIEETTEDFSPAPTFKSTSDPVSIDVGDGYIQAKGVKDGVNYSAPPKVERVGDGLFFMDNEPHVAGRRRKLERR